MTINFSELRDLLNTIAQTDITDFSLKSEEFELSVRKTPPQTTVLSLPTPVTSETVPITPTSPPAVITTSPEPVATPPVEATPSPEKKKWLAVTSPMVGTFYRAPAPGESPFAEVGQRLKTGDVVCIIEAMKLMNEIEAEVSGQIMEIVVQNGEPVEYGQTLMWVNPN